MSFVSPQFKKMIKSILYYIDTNTFLYASKPKIFSKCIAKDIEKLFYVSAFEDIEKQKVYLFNESWTRWRNIKISCWLETKNDEKQESERYKLTYSKRRS